MADRTVAEFSSLDEINGGDIYIGYAESYLIKYLVRAVKGFTEKYPLLRYHLSSGNTEQLDRGLLDLCCNGTVFVREGLCYMLTFDKLSDTSEESGLCFRPLEPVLKTKMYIIWKEYQVFSPLPSCL